MTKLGFASAIGSLLLVAACGTDDAKGDGDDAVDDGDVDDTVDAGDGDEPDADLAGWETLADGAWELPATGDGREGYYCIYATIPADTSIKAFKPLIPLGTHHTVMTVYEGSKPDGVEPCQASTNGTQMIYGSGVGSPEFAFPPGIGLKLKAGTRLLINLHLYNTTDGVLTGTSGVLFRRAEPAEIIHEAEVVLAGPVGFTIPKPVNPGDTHKISGNCQVSALTSGEPLKVFARSMHMHKLGRHLKTTIIRGDVETVIQDSDYDFDSQSFEYMTPEFTLEKGDVIRTTCTFENTTGDSVGFGDSSDNEMCFTDLMYYPAQGAQFLCIGAPETGE